MPQEIEVWYLIPALRKELAKIFINDHNLTQKEAAGVIGITEPAISQYLKEKRGSELIFNKEQLSYIKKAADRLINEKENITKELYNLCVDFRGSKEICDIHRKYDSSLSIDCNYCVE